MNLILFAPAEIEQPLPRSDRRAVHILDVLRRNVGESFDVGIINGPRGKATLAAVHPAALELSFTWPDPNAASTPRAPAPITLIVGMPRPQTARDILRDATTLGVASIHFVATEKSEPSYARSTLWTSGEWRRHVLLGAEQAFDPHVPEISHGQSLGETLHAPDAGATRLALDNYEASASLGQLPLITAPVTLAIGAERGWSARERELLRARQFAFVHLGARVLRTETACIAALTLVRAKLGLM